MLKWVTIASATCSILAVRALETSAVQPPRPYEPPRVHLHQASHPPAAIEASGRALNGWAPGSGSAAHGPILSPSGEQATATPAAGATPAAQGPALTEARVPTTGSGPARPASTPTGEAVDGRAPPQAPVPVYSPSLLGSYRKSLEIEEEVMAACGRYGVPMPLARAVLMYESGGNDNLVSSAGARGYFQVMPATFRLLKVPTNIEAGVKYLSWLLRDFGREDDALAAYNAGPGRVSSGRPLPMETLQYVVGVGLYRTLLTREEAEIRDEASSLDLYRVGAGEDWTAVSRRTSVPILDLRLFNAFLAPRPLRAGSLIAYPRVCAGPLVDPPLAPGGSASYTTRRGDNHLLLAFAFDVELERFRLENALWRVQVPLEGMRLAVNPRASSTLLAETASPLFSPQAARSQPPPADLSARAGPPQDTHAPARPSADPAAGGTTRGGAPSMSSPAAGASSRGSPRTVSHKVQPGETLYRIAVRYGVTVEAIRRANGLSGTRLRAGQTLKIPISS